MGVFLLAIAQQSGEVSLSRRGRKQIVATHHLIDAGLFVIHHDGEVVGRHPVTATQHEIIDHSGVGAAQQVGDRVLGCLGAKPQRWRAPGVGLCGALR